MTGSTRTIWVMALVAVVSLGAGLGLSRMIISPADAAAQAQAPEAGPITVAVEERELANDVVLRGDASYENPVSVVLETGDIGGPAIVTGQVPVVGSTIDAGQVVLEVTGRPVILLTGELPVYRTLRAGVSGPDVVQLKGALAALGIGAGDPASDRYDAATAAGVQALYARVGYPAPGAGEDVEQAVEAAQDAVRGAQDQVASAQRELAAARAGTSQPERVRLQAAVNTAAARLEEVTAACAADPTTCLNSEVVAAQGELAAAVADRDAGNAAPDVSAQQASLSAAQAALTDAQAELAAARSGSLTPLPASELVYLAATPRRVDTVEVRRGASVAGSPVMSVSGATLQITGTVPDVDAALITAGAPVTITLPDGVDVAGIVESVGGVSEPSQDGAGSDGTDGSGDGSGEVAEGRTRVVVVPGELTEEQRFMLQGSNVRMTIPVSATDGVVLSVPTAALTAGPGGEARVEVLDPDGTSTLVTVETGLAAGGFVEVSAVDGELSAGDRVVVGVSSADTGTDEESDTTGTDSEDAEG